MPGKLALLPWLLPVSFLLCLAVPAVEAARAEGGGTDLAAGDLCRVSSSDGALSVTGAAGVAHLGSLEPGPGALLYGVAATGDAAPHRIDPGRAVATLINSLDIGSRCESTLAFASAGTTASHPGSNAPYSVNLFAGEHEHAGRLAPMTTSADITALAAPTSATLVLMTISSLVVIMGRRR